MIMAPTSDVHTHTQPFNGPLAGTTSVGRDCLGRPVPEETVTHSHPTCSSDILYQLPPSTTIYSIILVQFTCLTVLFHNLSPGLLWSSRKVVTQCIELLPTPWSVLNFL